MRSASPSLEAKRPAWFPSGWCPSPLVDGTRCGSENGFVHGSAAEKVPVLGTVDITQFMTFLSDFPYPRRLPSPRPPLLARIVPQKTDGSGGKWVVKTSQAPIWGQRKFAVRRSNYSSFPAAERPCSSSERALLHEDDPRAGAVP